MTDHDVVTVVTGSTRCGTSLCMRMLHAGGLEPYADNLVSYETTRSLGLPRDAAWLRDCRGRTVKLLEPLAFLPLPRTLRYRFVLMRRDPVQQARSQVKFMRLLNGVSLPAHAEAVLAASIRRDMPRMVNALATYGRVMELRFESVLADPDAASRRVAAFLERDLDTAAMAAQVVPRSPECLPGLLETRYLDMAPIGVAP